MIAENKHEYAYFEIWLDYITDVDENFVQQLVTTGQERLIFLFRRQNLEPIHVNIQKRKQILCVLENTNALVDLDITTQTEELAYIQKKHLNLQTIISYHNYEETPHDALLKKIILDMECYHPTVYKFATMCQEASDAVRLLQLLLAMKKQGKKYIVLGMGEKGSITRIFGTLWGNEIIFAPKEKTESSAPGQLTHMQLKTIFTMLQQSN